MISCTAMIIQPFTFTYSCLYKELVNNLYAYFKLYIKKDRQ